MRPSKIVIHCSDSPYGCQELIRKWHAARKRQIIPGGYHAYILNGYTFNSRTYYPYLDGSIEQGRPYNKMGAHALGLNQDSLGVCVMGQYKFTGRQLVQLNVLISDLVDRFEIQNQDIVGHYETPRANGKTCPNMPGLKLREFFRGRKTLTELQNSIARWNHGRD